MASEEENDCGQPRKILVERSLPQPGSRHSDDGAPSRQFARDHDGVDELLRRCTVRIINGETSGTGFFIAPGRILTCAHVVEDDDCHTRHAQRLRVVWSDNEFSAEVQRFFPKPYPDLALLIVNLADHPCAYLRDGAKLGDQLYAFGYPAALPGGDSALFTYEGPTASTAQVLLKLKQAQASPGMSGAPLLNLRTRTVCGILKSSRDTETDLGGRAVPVMTVAERLRVELLSHDEFHRHTSFWGNASAIAAAEQGFSPKTQAALAALGYTVKAPAPTLFDSATGRQCARLFPDSILHAELRAPLHTQRFLVGCKYLLSNLVEESIHSLSTLADTLSTRLQPVSPLFVFSADLPNDAQALAHSLGVRTIRLSELQSESFDPEALAARTKAAYDKDDTARVYIKLSCQVTEGGQGTVYKPVEAFLDEFFRTTRRAGVAVLGNFGSGKTSLCRHYSYLLAQRWKPGSGYYLPVYVNLRELENLQHLERDLYQLLQLEYQIGGTLAGFKQWLLHGSTLLLLDGFDEMASKMDRGQIDRSLECLRHFCAGHSVKIVLTCRTHFFKTQIEEKALGSLLRLYMREWGTEELTEYVEKSLPHDKNTSLQIIHDTYNLKELARTPIFLNMIAATIKDLGEGVNQARLYQIYTDRWIQSQDYRSKLSPDDKKLFMEELAMEMFMSNKLRVGHQLLPPRLKSLFSVSDYDKLRSLDEDVRTCSFLVRDPDGEYHFSHKSFMEFFVGRRLAEEVKSSKLDSFSKRTLTFEVAGFFANYFDDESALLIRGVLREPVAVVRANFALALGRLALQDRIVRTLVVAVETDTDEVVRRSAIDALALFHDEAVIEQLAVFGARQDEVGLHCLQSLRPHFRSSKVLELFSQVLRSDYDPMRILAVLDNIAETRIEHLNAEVLSLGASEKWKHEGGLSLALIRVILTQASLSLALLLRDIERHALNAEVRQAVEQAKTELRPRFAAQVERDARDNFSGGTNSYRKNEGLLRAKYDFLIDDETLKRILDQFYSKAGAPRGGKRRNKRCTTRE